MTYLLDVNVLLALGLLEHEFHDRITRWVGSVQASQFATCSITELGFVRIVAQAPIYGFNVEQARALLLRLKSSERYSFTFIPDANDISHLHAWVKAPRQITDGHLARLAQANHAVLATLDEKIPGSFLIP